jgi:hypothetical protein
MSSPAVAAPLMAGQTAPNTTWTCERQDGDGGDANAGDDVYSDIYWAIHDAHTYDFIANVHSNQEHARLIAAAPDLLEALRFHKAWADSERAGPDYGGQTRDTHPDGERIWRAWWDNQLDLCGRANTATDAAIAKAEGR